MGQQAWREAHPCHRGKVPFACLDMQLLDVCLDREPLHPLRGRDGGVRGLLVDTVGWDT
jgi:hypothetical protein